MQDIYLKLFIYIVIVLSSVIHEYAHGYVANEMGDRTARDSGRLTLNPIAHMDIFGTVIVPLTLLMVGGVFIGWAKPVPVNPYALRGKKAMLKVALAGPMANMVLAILISIGAIIANLISPGVISGSILGLLIKNIIYTNIILALFNLIPVPPLDGSKVAFDLFGEKYARKLAILGPFSMIIALFVGLMILPTIASIILNLITGFGWAL